MKTKSRTSLVLMELIITIMFFSLCSAVCVQLFVQSHLISKDAYELNNAVAKAQGFAEVMRGTDGSFSSVLSMYPEAVNDNDNSFEIYYDSEFNSIKTDNPSLDADYVSVVEMNQLSKIQNMNITVVRLSDDETIYTLDATKYIRNK